MSLLNFREVYAPRFFLEAMDELADDILPRIEKLEYEDDEAKTDTLRLTVSNFDMRLTDDPRFAQGARFRFRFGYLDDISDVKTVVLAKAKPTYKNTRSLEMVAFGLTADMNRNGNPENYGPISSSEVARIIAARYNFDVDIEESNDARVQHRLQSANETDFQFLMSLAVKLNWDFYVEGAKLHFHHKRFETPAEDTFIYYVDGTGTLISFTPEVKMTAPAKTKSTGIDPKTGDKTDKGGADEGGKNRLEIFTYGAVGALIPGRPGGPKGSAGQGGLVKGTPETDPRVIGIHGNAAAKKIDMAAVKAEIEIVPTPRFRARANIHISGVDKIYCGNWRVSKSKHTFDAKGAYKCSGSIKRDAGKAKDPNLNKKDGGAGTGDGSPRRQVNTNRATITPGPR